MVPYVLDSTPTSSLQLCLYPTFSGVRLLSMKMRTVSNLLAPVLVRPVAAARARLGVSAPAGGVVLHGAAGAGKTALALATARRLR